MDTASIKHGSLGLCQVFGCFNHFDLLSKIGCWTTRNVANELVSKFNSIEVLFCSIYLSNGYIMMKRKVDLKDVTCDPQNTTLCNRFESADEYFKNHICYRTKIPIYKWDGHCWKCGKMTPHISYDFCCGSDHSIGSLPLLDKKLMELYPFIKRVYSHTMRQEIIANTCIHCGSLQGNFFIIEELADMASEGAVFKINKWI